MKILISNDDGIESPGLIALRDAVSSLGIVTVVAPQRERSTSGHSLTLHKPLRMNAVDERMYATSGTPADWASSRAEKTSGSRLSRVEAMALLRVMAFGEEEAKGLPPAAVWSVRPTSSFRALSLPALVEAGHAG